MQNTSGNSSTTGHAGNDLTNDPGKGLEPNITQDEYNAFCGIAQLLTADVYYGPPDPINERVEDFLFRADDLFSGLYDFTTGRFRTDGGLYHLQSIFSECIELHPHMAKKYFYVYAQLMQLLLAVHSVEPFISHYSHVFGNLSEKSEFFEPKTAEVKSGKENSHE